MITGSPLIFSIFVYNLVFGSGVLLLPKAFWGVGYILGSILLFLLAILSWTSCVFVIESLSLANYKHRVNDYAKLEENDEVETNNSNTNRLLNHENFNDEENEVKYFYIEKKFEVAEMAKLFFGRAMLIAFYFFMVLYLYGDLCIYLSVVGTTLRGLACSDISYNINFFNQTCTNLGSPNVFRIFTFLFFIILLPFVFTNIKKSVAIHIITLLLRFLAVIIMIVCASIRIYNNSSYDISEFRYIGIPNFFGICLYSFMCQHSLPSMVHYVTNKRSKFNYWILLSMATALIFYLLIVITASFAFIGDELDPIYSMNFVIHQNKIWEKFIYFYLMLFPTIALSASYPIVGITLRENIISLTEIIMNKPLEDNIRKWVFPLLAIVPSFALVQILPDHVSYFASYVGAYAGSFVQYFIPACLVIWGRKTVLRDFANVNLSNNRNSLYIFRNNIIPGFVIVWTFVGIGMVTYYFVTK